MVSFTIEPLCAGTILPLGQSLSTERSLCPKSNKVSCFLLGRGRQLASAEMAQIGIVPTE